MNFKFTSEKPLTLLVKSKGFTNFSELSFWVKNLTYKRNEDKNDMFCIIKDEGGTCSTKHAFLMNIADENEAEGLKLMLGIFKMNSKNTPKIASVLQEYGLKEMPEAHNYLKFNNEILDFTRKNSSSKDFEDDLLEEIEIRPDQITDFKVSHHKDFIKKYLENNSGIPFSNEDLWNIREKCIKALST